jgi:hypothetical protein
MLGKARTIFLLATSKSCRMGFSRMVRATPFSMYSYRRGDIPRLTNSSEEIGKTCTQLQ